ncbi:uncharacterized protein RCO7_04285 [Rhynchosporium graminicola]|uniref:Uncharacterized protein n=1 Tax=Rhynchosporium graminicola TaxID=2792576 RepID=A0A1E1LR94_9HELO|nr:uncharacterized protein RCO7_04285 [Rhynchosporium commune]
MRTSNSALLPLIAGTLQVLAQDSFSQINNIVQSANFNLLLVSPNATLNNRPLGALHNGAAHEQLAIFDFAHNATDNFVNFQLNYTQTVCTVTNTTGTFTVPCQNAPAHPERGPGLITWFEQYSDQNGPAEASQAMALGFLPWTNVAIAQVSFAGETGIRSQVAFDDDCLMYINQYSDDTLEPAYEYLNTPVRLYRWYLCDTYYSGYTYPSLTWVVGKAEPQNPTCQAVNVTRVFT